MKRILMILLPLIVIGVGGFSAITMVKKPAQAGDENGGDSPSADSGHARRA